MGIQRKKLDLECLQKLREIVESNEVSILAFNRADGGVGSYPMVNQALELDGYIWFFINNEGFLAQSLYKNPYVSIHVHDKNIHESLSLEGKACIEKNRARAYQYWNPLYRSWFPAGVVDEKLSMLKVKIQRAHLWQSPSEKPISLEAAFESVITGRPHLIQNEFYYECEDSS